MKLQLFAFLAVGSNKFTFVKPQRLHQQERKQGRSAFERVELRKDDELLLSKKGVIQNDPRRQAHKRSSNVRSGRKPKADIGILSIPQEASQTERGLSELYNCQGDQACNPSNVNFRAGNNTCIGLKACLNAGKYGFFTVDDNACVRESACERAASMDGGAFFVNANSCIGFESCFASGEYGGFGAGSGSCLEDRACKYAAREPGSFFTAALESCVGSQACLAGGFSGTFQADKKSCVGQKSCYNAGFSGDFVVQDNSCVGDESCHWAAVGDKFRASVSSCHGTGACKKAGFFGEFQAEDKSCLGEYACIDAASDRDGYFTARNGSCDGKNSCYGVTGGHFAASHKSCIGELACAQYCEPPCKAVLSQTTFQASLACVGLKACMNAGAKGKFQARTYACIGEKACSKAAYLGHFNAGPHSCNGEASCYATGSRGTFSVGQESCIGHSACDRAGFSDSSDAEYAERVVTIGDSSCIGNYACATPMIGDKGKVTIGSSSCTCDGCCRNLKPGSQIGDCQCTSIHDGCDNAPGPVVKLGSCQPSSSPSISSSPSTSVAPSQAPSSSPSISTVPSVNPTGNPSSAPSTAPSASSSPSSQPTTSPSVSQIPSSLPSVSHMPSGSPSTSHSPSTSSVPSSAPSVCVLPDQDLMIVDKSNMIIGLTDAAKTASLGHLVTDHENEIQNMVFDYATNQLRLTKSTNVVDLSHLDNPFQYLTLDQDSMHLGLPGSPIDIDISSIEQDVSIKNNVVDISGGGTSADLSSLRVVHLQATIHNITGIDTSGTERRRLYNSIGADTGMRKLSLGGESGPNVRYGGKVSNGFSLFARGRLLRTTITANSVLEGGDLVVSIVDCTDVDNVKSIGSSEDALVLRAGHGRSSSKKFAAPIHVEAEVVLCFEATRFGEITSNNNNNNSKGTAASLVLTLEQ